MFDMYIAEDTQLIAYRLTPPNYCLWTKPHSCL